MALRDELGALVRVVATRTRVEWLLATRPLDRCLDELTPEHRPASVDDAEVERVARWTERLLRNRRLPRTTCLHRALTRYSLLARAGADPEFLLGLGTDGLEGHAWVTLDGRPWREGDVASLVPTFRHSLSDRAQ